jgi:putative ABC transport system permease protein
MIKNYFKTAWRNIWKHKTLSFINLGGLAIGITAVLLIGLYIQSELSYDKFHSNRQNIYRIGFQLFQQGISTGTSPEFTAPFSAEAKNIFPEVKSYCRLSARHEGYLSFEEKSIKAKAITYTDESFFNFFSFTLKNGNPSSALTKPNSIVLSETLAKKIFGEAEAAGKIISLDGKNNYTVTGVVMDAPGNSSIQYEALASISTLYNNPDFYMDWNGGWQYMHYIQVENKNSVAALEKKFENFLWTNFNEKYASTSKTTAALQPLSKIHLQYSEDSANTRTNLYVFGIIALLILIISCINYINLSVAGASARFKEVGVRKVLGAARLQLVKQFMGETVLATAGSLLIAICITLGVMPLYKELTGKSIDIFTSDIFYIIMLMIALVVIISLAAGGYLAFYLSALNPVKTFKMALPKSGRKKLAKALVVVQFTITAALITAVWIVHIQLNYVKDKPLGFDKEKIVVLPLTGDDVREKALLIKNRFAAISGVSRITALSEVPYDDITQNGFLPEGSKNHLTIHQLDADDDLLNTMNIKLLSGNYFSAQRPSELDGYVINKALADRLGWKEPLNKIISRDGGHKIIGVVDNFHFASLYDKIEPLIITSKPWKSRFGFLAVKYNSENPAMLIAQLQTTWKKNFSSTPFDYWFLDEAFNNLYKSEDRFRQLFFSFSVLSVLLSLAGIFGLVLLNIQQKTKEIGIRKVLGAGITDIIKLTAKNLIILILAASVIAVPAAWYYSGSWLQNFAYRVELRWWMFALPGVVVTLFALIIISLQTGRAAAANPVKSLRTE